MDPTPAAGLSSGAFHKSIQRGGPAKDAWSYEPMTGHVSPVRHAQEPPHVGFVPRMKDYRQGVDGALPGSLRGGAHVNHVPRGDHLSALSPLDSPSPHNAPGSPTRTGRLIQLGPASTLRPAETGWVVPGPPQALRHREYLAPRPVNSLATADIPGAEPKPQVSDKARAAGEEIRGTSPLRRYASPTRALKSLDVSDISGAAPNGRTSKFIPASYRYTAAPADARRGPSRPLTFTSNKRDTIINRPLNCIEYFTGS